MWRIDYVEADGTTVGSVLVRAATFQEAVALASSGDAGRTWNRNCHGLRVLREAEKRAMEAQISSESAPEALF